MPAKRLSMRKIREVLRLKYECQKSIRDISISCSIGKSTVSDYLNRSKAAGLDWPLPEGLDDTILEQKLFPSASATNIRERIVPDWNEIHKELKRKGVTLSLIWHEYKTNNPEGYQYSWFCQQYADWVGKIDVVMRQEHRAGEKLFVDYAGQTMGIVDRDTGEVKEAQVFVAVLGASNFTYSEATWGQGLADWTSSHVRAFQFFGGVPEVLIPDNLKSGVKKVCYYDPDINPTYQDLANHYSTVVLPARVRKPRDKAKVESGVQVVERWILARLRNHTFFSLDELNQEIRKLLVGLNAKPFQKLSGSRKQLFEELDRPALKPLPVEPYCLAHWKKATVNIDYHVEVDGHYYSVPHQLVKKKIDVRMTSTTVECLYKNKRVAAHRRSLQKGRHTTIKEHMPSRHQKYLEWSPERFLRWAGKIGPQTVRLTENILSSRPYPQQAYRTLLGILRLGKSYGDGRLEAACARAIEIGATSYRSIESILKNGLENKPVSTPEPSPPVHHNNIRGAHYYQQSGGGNA
jgi:transposase